MAGDQQGQLHHRKGVLNQPPQIGVVHQFGGWCFFKLLFHEEVVIPEKVEQGLQIGRGQLLGDAQQAAEHGINVLGRDREKVGRIEAGGIGRGHGFDGELQAFLVFRDQACNLDEITGRGRGVDLGDVIPGNGVDVARPVRQDQFQEFTAVFFPGGGEG